MSPAALSRVNGHLSTVVGCAGGLVRSAREAPEWIALPIVSRYGATRLRAVHHATSGADELVVTVHGLGGSATSPYQSAAASTLSRQGFTVLRLCQRGADRRGTGLHHAGLWEDLAAVVEQWASPRYRRIHLLGFSMGGHVALRAACQRVDRLASVAALCSPLHLEPAVEHVDRPAMTVYRTYLLRGLRAMYAAYARAQDPSTGSPGTMFDLPCSTVRSLRRVRSFDEQVIVPHFGFGSADRYYAAESAGAHLGGLRVPALLVYTRYDPIVSLESILPGSTAPASIARALARQGAEVRWLDAGGHLSFPRRARSGSPFAGSLYEGLSRWFRTT